MTGDRMRRVDEAMREVLSGAITSELKDPRVGFVTVTAVETSPDLRHARVFVSVLGDARRAPPLAARRCDSAHGFLQRRVAERAAAQAHADARVRLRRHAPSAGMRINELLDERGGALMSGANGAASVARAGARRAARGATALPARPRTSARTATRSARWPRCSRC